MIKISPIPAFQDNYIWLIANGDKAWVVDPGDAKPVLNYLKQHQLTLSGILLTHHHFDHIGGVDKLISQFSVPVYGNPSRIRQISDAVSEGDIVRQEGFEFTVIEVPGHTLDHIAYFGEVANYGPCLFCGDTLFSAGCGRLFEGSPDMMLNSLSKLAELPAETRVFCAHEYTLANLSFAKAVMPESGSVQRRIELCKNMRTDQQPTLPAVLGEELTYNPFLMTDDERVIKAAAQHLGQTPTNKTDVFAAIRQWKDRF